MKFILNAKIVGFWSWVFDLNKHFNFWHYHLLLSLSSFWLLKWARFRPKREGAGLPQLNFLATSILKFDLAFYSFFYSQFCSWMGKETMLRVSIILCWSFFLCWLAVLNLIFSIDSLLKVMILYLCFSFSINLE